MRTKHENKAWDQTTSRIKHKRNKNTYSRGVFFINESFIPLNSPVPDKGKLCLVKKIGETLIELHDVKKLLEGTVKAV